MLSPDVKAYPPQQETLVQKLPHPQKNKLKNLFSWWPGSKARGNSYTALEDPSRPLKGRASHQSQEHPSDEYKGEAEQMASRPVNRHTKQAIPTVRNEAENLNIARLMHRAGTLQGEPEGMMEAKLLYLRVLGEADNKRIEGYKLMAARQLGLIFEKSGDEANAIKYYEIAIQQKCLSSPYELALLLEKRAEERAEPYSSKDFKRAFLLLEGVADYKSDARFALARFLEDGKGTERDMPRAISLYEREGNRDKFSAYRLARLYASGVQENGNVFIPQDLAKALEYYNQARLLHHPKAEEAHARFVRFLQMKDPEAISRGYIEGADRRSKKNRFY